MSRNPLVAAMIRLYSWIPEGAPRHALRLAALRVRETLPKRAYINRGDTVVQVGTPNPKLIHYYLDIVGPSGRVVVVEPERTNFEQLEAEARKVQAPNLSLVKRAAWSKREMLNLTVSKDAFDHKVEVPEIVHDNDFVPGNYTGTEQVQADTIDNIVAELGIDRIDFAEIHVNGAEIEVLRGMERIMPRVARLHVKGHAKFRADDEPISREIVGLLRDRGFRTAMTRTSVARDAARNWGQRSGDVYAARLR